MRSVSKMKDILMLNMVLRTGITCNIYTVQQDTQSVLMSEFIHHLC